MEYKFTGTATAAATLPSVSRLDSEDLGEDLTSTFALAAVIFMFHVSYSDQNALQLKCSVE